MSQDQKKYSRIVFLNNPDEARLFLISDSESVADTLFIALTPETCVFLKEKGTHVENTLNYFTNASHITALEKGQELLDYLRQNLDFGTFDPEVSGAYQDLFVFWGRYTINYCLWLIEIITNALRIHQPQVISCNIMKKNHPGLFPLPEEGYLGCLAQKIALQQKITFRPFSLSADTKEKRVPLQSSLLYLLRLYKFKALTMLTCVSGPFGKKATYYFTTLAYGFAELLKSARQTIRNNRFEILPGPIIYSSRLSTLLIRLSAMMHAGSLLKQRRWFNRFTIKIENNITLFSLKGLSFADLVARKVKGSIADYVLSEITWSFYLADFLKFLRPAGVISNGNRSDDEIIAGLCKKTGIPAFLISHGSHVPVKNKYEMIAWGEHGRGFLRAPFSRLLMQTPLSEDYLKEFPTAADIFRTGPLIWGKRINSEKNEETLAKIFSGPALTKKERIILHAGTPKMFSRFLVYETPDEYLKAIIDLAAAIEKIPDTVLIIKFRPSAMISRQTMEKLVKFSPKVKLSIEEPFLDVLGISDILVSFSSTAIEEALQNKIPVLLYGGGGRYQHVAAQTLTKEGKSNNSAIYHIGGPEDLISGINTILDLHKNRSYNGEFFERYIYPQNIRVPLDKVLSVNGSG